VGRPILDEALLHPAIRDKVAAWGVDVVREVQGVIAATPLVVVGMKMNPFPRKARSRSVSRPSKRWSSRSRSRSHARRKRCDRSKSSASAISEASAST